MNRDKPYRLQQEKRHNQRAEIVQWVKIKREDCNKPKKGKCNG